MHRQSTLPNAADQRYPHSPPLSAKSTSQELSDLLGGRTTLVLGGVAAFLAILYFWSPWTTTIAQGSCVVAVDYQGSTAPMLGEYQKWAASELAECANNGHADLAIIPITSATEADYTSEVVRVAFSAENLDIGNEQDRKLLVQKKVEDAVAAAFSHWDSDPAKFRGGTDIIGAPLVAKQLLSGDGQKTLVILSDAMENHDVKMQKASLTPEAIKTILGNLEASGRVPDLPGVKVKMLGVNAGTLSTDVPRKRLNEVKVFWTQYFAAAGADLVSYAKQP